MAKKQQAQSMSLFDTPEEKKTCSPDSRSSSPTPPASIDPLACPRCGKKSLESKRELGKRYCVVCQEDGDNFYFVPVATISPGQEIVREAFDNVSQETLLEIDAKLGTSVALDDDPLSHGNGKPTDLFGNPLEKEKREGLSGKFLIPPFTVLDAKQGYWKDRKAEWLALGIAGEEGREAKPVGFSAVCNTVGGYKAQEKMKADPNFAKHRGVLHRGNGGMDWGEEYTGGCAWAGAGSSVFDPVLCEIVYRWFAPPAGHILDPFAGESTKGIVATYLGYEYTGVELREEQLEANRQQAEKIGVRPEWRQGDSFQLDSLLPAGKEYDCVFTSPPYYDLEIYSKSEKDGSAFETYDKFMNWYREIFRQAVKRLKWNRFLVVKIGEVRDGNGWYRNFVGDNIKCFMDLKLRYYNEAVLLTSIGSLPLRIGKAFGGYRKLGKTHQNVLVFYKGSNPDQIKEKFGKVFNDDETFDLSR